MYSNSVPAAEVPVPAHAGEPSSEEPRRGYGTFSTDAEIFAGLAWGDWLGTPAVLKLKRHGEWKAYAMPTFDPPKGYDERQF